MNPSHDAPILGCRLQFQARGYVQEAVQQPGIAQINLWRFDLALGQIGAPGFQTPYHEGGFKNIQVPAYGVVRDAECTPQLRTVPRLSMIMSKHGPEAIQQCTGDGNAELGDVLGQKSFQKVSTPAIAFLMAVCGEGTWKATPKPQEIGLVHSNLGQGKAGEFVIGDATRQALRTLPEQAWGCAAEHKKTGWRRCSIRQHPERRKEFGTVLYFVQYDQSAQGGKRKQRIGKTRQIGSGFEIEEVSRPASSPGKFTRKGRFAHLPRPKQGNYRIPGYEPLQSLYMCIAPNHNRNDTKIY